MGDKPVFAYPLFALGFRVFFLLAGLSALVLMALWNAMTHGGLHLANYYPAEFWFSHELLFGYAAAVIAGCLLSLAQQGQASVFCTDRLASLALLWLYGRIAPFYAGLLPDVMIAALDLAFLPALALTVLPVLRRQSGVLPVLALLLLSLLALANALLHGQVLGWSFSGWTQTGELGLKLAASLWVLALLTVAGEILPTVTERALNGVACIRNPLLDMAAIAFSALALILWLLALAGWPLLLAALAALLTNLLRLSGWLVARVLYLPLLWVLYFGFAWILLGFLLLALSAYQWLAPTWALQAFTLGGLGVSSLGFMARLALIQSGRVLKASNIMALAFGLINIAVILQVLFAALIPSWLGQLLGWSVYAWLAAFALFVFSNWSLLLQAQAAKQ